MHVSALALESPTIASVVSLCLAIIIAFAVAIGYRPRSVLLLAGGFVGLCVYFGMLAASAGPAPMISRLDMAFWIRHMLLVAYALFVTWAILFVGEMIRYGRRTVIGRTVLLVVLVVLLSGCTVDAHVVVTHPVATPRPVVATFITPTPVQPSSPLAAPESPLAEPVSQVYPWPDALTPDVRPYTDGLPLPGTTSGVVGNNAGD